MYYLVGLGNPGTEYAHTRHNIGWLVLDSLNSQFHFPEARQQNSVSGRTTSGKISGIETAVLYPDTFMNNSGAAVAKFVPKEELSKLVVLHDDIDLPLGQVRISFGRGDGGHNGLKSIIQKTGTRDFIRVRIGIAKTGFWPWQKGVTKRPAAGSALERFVLGKLSRNEMSELEKINTQVAEVMTVIVQYGYVTAMNRYN